MKLACLLSISLLSTASFAATSSRCPGEQGAYHTNFSSTGTSAGGFVAYTAYAEAGRDKVFVGPAAAVCGNAVVRGEVKIAGSSIVTGNAYIDGERILISGDLMIKGSAEIKSNTTILGTGTISSGKYADQVIRLEGQAPHIPQPLDPYRIYSQLRNFMPDGYAYPTGGYYDRFSKLKQSLEAVGGNPCRVKFYSERRLLDCRNGTSSFYNEHFVVIDLKDVSEIRTYKFRTNHYATLLDVVDKRLKVERYHRIRRDRDNNCAFTGPWDKGWTNSNLLMFQDTAAAIESFNASDAAKMRSLLENLVRACKQR